VFEIEGTPSYMSPEMVGGNPFNYKVDIWSLGVILWLMLFNKYPFGSSIETSEIYKNIVYICDPKFSIDKAFEIQ
jgi:serine/threonine protein kinase